MRRDVEGFRPRRHKKVHSSRIVGSFRSFLFRFFELVQQTAGFVDWATYVFFWAALPLSSILELDGPCLVRDIWISIIESTNLICFGKKLVNYPRSTLRSCDWYLEHLATSFPRSAQERVKSALRITLHLNEKPARTFPSQRRKQESESCCKSLLCVVICKAPSEF